MQRIRKISIAALTVLLLYALSSSALAHSGKTDSNGGHTDHDTGEYHYHHGYPAHQHEDRDSDGYPEHCPFKNQSNVNEGNRPSEYDSGHNAYHSEDKKPGEKKNNGTTLKIVIAIVLLAFWISPVFTNKRK